MKKSSISSRAIATPISTNGSRTSRETRCHIRSRLRARTSVIPCERMELMKEYELKSTNTKATIQYIQLSPPIIKSVKYNKISAENTKDKTILLVKSKELRVDDSARSWA